MIDQLISQARDHIARTWTAQGWRAEQSLDHPGYWDVWTLDATGQRRIILARFLTANTAALMCFISTALPQLCDLAEAPVRCPHCGQSAIEIAASEVRP